MENNSNFYIVMLIANILLQYICYFNQFNINQFNKSN